MNILMVSSEAVPYSKSGGLADVLGSLSPALAKKGETVCIFMPMYSFIDRKGFRKGPSYSVPMLGRDCEVSTLRKKLDGVEYVGKKMTVIGAGGAASAIQVQAALDGVRELTIINRRDAFFEQAKSIVGKLRERTECIVNLYDLADTQRLRQELDSSDIYIDATPCGMKPLEGIASIPDKTYLHPGLVVMDTVYAPRRTKLLQWAEEMGCHNFNGLDMMLYQGATAFKLWTGKDMPIDFIRDMLF